MDTGIDRKLDSLKHEDWEFLMHQSVQVIKEAGTGINIQFFKGGIYAGVCNDSNFVSPSSSGGSVWVNSDIARVTGMFGGNGLALNLPVLKEYRIYRGAGSKEFEFTVDFDGLDLVLEAHVSSSSKRKENLDIHRFRAPACAFAMLGGFFKLFFTWAHQARELDVPFPFPWPKNDVLKLAGFYGEANITLKMIFGDTMIPAMILVEDSSFLKEVSDD